VKIVVTGAAGFIGSHLCEALLARGHEVVGYDNLSAGKLENLQVARRSHRFAFIQGNILDLRRFEGACRGADVIYHLAADPLVKESAQNPVRCFEQNATGTFRVLEAARREDVGRFAFASTSAVYGDAKRIPTPENEPLMPISNYGASKVAGESYVQAYACAYGIRGTVLRYANIFGERSLHGVMRDFYFKLKQNPQELEILGDGMQDKSYLYVSDCVEATVIASKGQKGVYEAFNIGSRQKHTVKEIARLICSITGARPKFRYTGGKRGWTGDVPLMLLSTKKIEKLGWRERVRFEDGVRKYIAWLAESG